MPSTDDRIVKIEFDNSSFERKIGETLASIGRLNSALKFEGATQGLSDISAAADKVNMGGMGERIEDVSKKFLALGTVAITILSNITSRAMEAGAQIVKSLTLDPILDGFREYETNIGSIQTILANTASKGTTLDDVTKALDQLNQYSDKTIYNFGEMARNIGTFTAAGVDLQTSVDSIKGIANLAAMSGSTSAQASTAMYQLSQAIATGTLHLIDWNSVVNAGMGGEAFKSALFETGKAMGTLANVPMGQTFKEWEDGGNSFRDSLQDGWITADVLTTTLASFTGDMTEEMLLAKGFSEEQALNILKTAEIAKNAATEVKTFTQLIGTVQEAVGTGWADSFRIVIGNFTEAKELWTNVNNSISGFVSKSADARNELLQGWKDLGGRTLLIESLSTAFQNLGLILQPIKDAFRDIFPEMTAQRLYDMTAAFSRFATALQPTQETVSKIRSIFDGFFSVLSIGWEIVKEGTQFLFNLGKSILGIFGPGATDGLAKLGDGLKNLKEGLVDGGGIERFFEGLTNALKKPLDFLEKVKDAIGSVFDLFDDGTAEAVGDAVGRVGDRFKGLGDIFDGLGGIWDRFKGVLEGIGDILSGVWDTVSNWFHELGGRLADTMKEGDFDAVLDALNVALLGGIAGLLAKFIKDGFSFDIGSGFLEKIGKSFEQLTGVLSAMQANIKANALLKIAGAIAILTASVLVLSMIDSEALTKALMAMSVGFGQLIGAFSLLTKITADPRSAASFGLVAGGMILLAGAVLILSIAVRILAGMSWEEMAKGLLSVTVLIGGLSLAVKLMSGNAGGMIATGIGLMGIAAALVILSIAMKIFATMSWEEMAKGLLGVGVGLLAIAGALKLMPKGPTMALQGVGLMAIGVSLLILAAAVATFGNMEWETIGKGMAGIGGGLLIIAGAMNLMPANMPILALGLIAVAIALNGIATATKIFASMDWDEIARGLTAMAGSLLILAGAMYLMGNNLAGGAALIVAAIGLGMLAAVVKQFSKMTWDDISHGLLAMGIALAAIAGAALLLQPATGAILALGAALIVLGIGFTAIGLGIFLLAKGLETIVSLGKKVAGAMADVLKGIGAALPALLTGLAEGIVAMVQVFVEAAPVFAKAIGVIIDQIIDTIIRNMPKIMDLISFVIGRIIDMIELHGPRLIDVGFKLLIHFLKGIRDNIGEVVNVVADIITNFLDAFKQKIPEVGKSLADAIIQMFETAAYETGRVAGTLLVGIGQNFIQGLIDGVDSQTDGLASKITAIPGQVLEWIGDVLKTLWDKGVDIITGFLNGIDSFIGNVTNFFHELPGNVVEWVGDVLGTLAEKGADIINGLWNGMKWVWNEASEWVGNIRSWIYDAFPAPGEILKWIGEQIFHGLWNGLKNVWQEIKDWVLDKVNWIKDAFKRALSIFSPSRVMMQIGEYTMEGYQIGLKDGWKDVERWMDNEDIAGKIKEHFETNLTPSITKAIDTLSTLNDGTDPVITPVVDMTEIYAAGKKMAELWANGGTIKPKTSLKHASVITKSPNPRTQPTTPAPINPIGPSEISFEQNIYAPEQLSVADIYRQTRNQIALAKEKLSIP